MVERLCTYRRLLTDLAREGTLRVFSHNLAALEGATAAQVRRDLMTIGYSGSPARGYDVEGLLAHIDALFTPARAMRTIIVGMGRLGGALAAYFAGREGEHQIVATFDVDPQRTGRVVHGCHCYPMSELEDRLEREPATVAVIAVPAENAQEVADRLLKAGVVGLLNFAPVRLRVPPEIFVEHIDISVSLNKVAFFGAARGAPEAE